MIDFVVHDGLFAGETADQIFADPLPGFVGRNVQMAASIQIVETDHRQIAWNRETAAFCLQQHAVCDNVVAEC